MAIYEEWLLKAKRDLDTANALLEKAYYDTAIYHTQQCAEKASKGYCVYKLQPLIKTHDLEKILRICIILDNSFQELDLFAISLNGLDVRFRCPDVEFEPEELEVIDAIDWSKQILNFVESKCKSI
jgi:HEPN domain-containing protein